MPHFDDCTRRLLDSWCSANVRGHTLGLQEREAAAEGTLELVCRALAVMNISNGVRPGEEGDVVVHAKDMLALQLPESLAVDGGGDTGKDGRRDVGRDRGRDGGRVGADWDGDGDGEARRNDGRVAHRRSYRDLVSDGFASVGWSHDTETVAQVARFVAATHNQALTSRGRAHWARWAACEKGG